MIDSQGCKNIISILSNNCHSILRQHYFVFKIEIIIKENDTIQYVPEWKLLKFVKCVKNSQWLSIWGQKSRLSSLSCVLRVVFFAIEAIPNKHFAHFKKWGILWCIKGKEIVQIIIKYKLKWLQWKYWKWIVTNRSDVWKWREIQRDELFAMLS